MLLFFLQGLKDAVPGEIGVEGFTEATGTGHLLDRNNYMED